MWETGMLPVFMIKHNTVTFGIWRLAGPTHVHFALQYEYRPISLEASPLSCPLR
jgi:hypothetical protein